MPELSNEVASQRQGYWRKNLQYLAILLVIWFVVSYGCAILFVDYLDQWEMSGFSLGFWYAQQGAMYVFVVLIFVYVWLMNRLDRKFAVREVDDEQLAVGHIAGRHRDVGNGAEFCRGDHRHSVDSAAAGEDPGSGGGHPHTAGGRANPLFAWPRVS